MLVPSWELGWGRYGGENIVFTRVSEAERKRGLVEEAGVGLVVLLSSQKRRWSFFPPLRLEKEDEDQGKPLFAEDPL